MDYKEKYEMALERARVWKEKSGMPTHKQGILDDIFPELVESENEKIRKELIEFVKSRGGFKQEYIAWLEKQGMSYTKKDVDDAYLKGVADTKNEIEKQYEANYQIRKDIATFIFNYRGDIKDRAKWMDCLGIKVSFVKEQNEQETLCDKCRKEHTSHSCKDITELGRCAVEHEQKPADKVEPKFKVGEWYVDKQDGTTLRITKVLGNTYKYITNTGEEYSCTHYSLEQDARKWALADAKDGDVLVTVDDKRPFIYKGCLDPNHPDSPVAYCGIDSEGYFCSGGYKSNHWWTDKNVHPATKEKHDLLFEKMKEAGYVWNAEKKELEKIEFNPDALIEESYQQQADNLIDVVTEKSAWSEEDERAIGVIRIALERPYDMECKWDRKFALDWLKSLKQRIGE